MLTVVSFAIGSRMIILVVVISVIPMLKIILVNDSRVCKILQRFPCVVCRCVTIPLHQVLMPISTHIPSLSQDLFNIVSAIVIIIIIIIIIIIMHPICRHTSEIMLAASSTVGGSSTAGF